MNNIRKFRDGIAHIYGMEKIIPSPYNIYAHGVLLDMHSNITKYFWGKKK